MSLDAAMIMAPMAAHTYIVYVSGPSSCSRRRYSDVDNDTRPVAIVTPIQTNNVKRSMASASLMIDTGPS